MWEAVDESCMASLNVKGVKTQLRSRPSSVQREKERRKETGHRHILARTDIAMEIQSYSPYYLLGNPQEAGYRCRKDITADLIRSALINWCWHLFSWNRVSVT